MLSQLCFGRDVRHHHLGVRIRQLRQLHPELERKEVEIEALRVEKEQRLQDLERREGEGEGGV
jgi:hypothetical protein